MKSTPDLTSVIHTASPFHLNIQDPIKDFLEPAIVGTTTVLKAAKDHGSLIKRVVVLSSFAAMRGGSKSNPEFYDESVWSPVTWEQAVQDRTQTYRGSKVRKMIPSMAIMLSTPFDTRFDANVCPLSQTLAEKAAWDFMEKEKPGFDLVAINPSLVFGPASLSLWSGSLSGVNTSNHRILDMVQGKMKDKIQPTGMFSWVDVRDVARAHVRALEVPEAGGKRFLLLAGYYSNKMIAEIIAELGPQYKARLPADLDAQDDLPKASERYNFSVERSTNLLGIAYTSLEKCIQDTVKSLEKLGS